MGSAEKTFKGGVIRNVDLSGGAITVSTSGGDSSVKGVGNPAGSVMKLKINENTTITVNTLYRSLNELAAGQTLKSVYYHDGTATVVHAIDDALMRRQQEEMMKKKDTTGDEQAKPAI
jgi:hypothetical protein